MTRRSAWSAPVMASWGAWPGGVHDIPKSVTAPPRTGVHRGEPRSGLMVGASGSSSGLTGTQMLRIVDLTKRYPTGDLALQGVSGSKCPKTRSWR